MGRFSDIGALRVINPTEWKKKVKEAMVAAGDRPIKAAVILGISQRLMYKWLTDPELADVKRVPNGEPIHGRRGQKTEEVPKRRRKSA